MSPVESDETDLTRKQRREQARSQRKAMEEAAAASAMRRTRLTQLGIVVSVVVVAIIVILVATGGGSKKGIPTKHEQNSVVHQVTALVGGIPQKGNVLGSSTAPRDAGVLRRPRVPDLPEIHAQRAAHRHLQMGAHGQAEDRIPLVGDSDARTRSVQGSAGGGARRRQAEQSLELHRDLLPRAGRRGLGLRHRKIHPGHSQSGPRPEPRERGRPTAANRRWPTRSPSRTPRPRATTASTARRRS